ncbi:hypothetical protein D3C76_1311700 [compost metagenome]
MATITFTSTDLVPEIHAVIATLNMWLRELPEQPPRPASGRFVYDDDGRVRLVVDVEAGE